MAPLIFGAQGQLGWELMRRFKSNGVHALGLDLPDGDITDREQVRFIIGEKKPDVAINASAYTAVDQAEKDEGKAFQVNKEGPAILAETCASYGIPLIHVSTDYVFDGTAEKPYTENDPVMPVGIYGKSKAAGEDVIRKHLVSHVIIRTAWLYGIHGNNFVKTMLRLGREHKVVKVVDDQWGCPTFAGDLAGAIIRIVELIGKKDDIKWGTYHYCGEGDTTWYGFALKIFEIAKSMMPMQVSQIIPIKTKDYPTLAERPAYSVLNCEKIKTNFDIHPKSWETRLRDVLPRMIDQERISS